MSEQSRTHQRADGGSRMALLPVFLKLEGRRVVLVGGGAVASAKLPELIKTGALVTVIAPRVRSEIATCDGLIMVQRGFVASDLDRAWFVVAAATPEVNRQVAVAADERGVFVNVVDDADRASAYMGGVLRKDGATIAVSTEGRAPALAGLLREGLEAVVPDDIEAWVTAASRLRQEQRVAGVPMGDRRPLLLAALNRLYEGRGVAAAQGLGATRGIEATSRDRASGGVEPTHEVAATHDVAAAREVAATHDVAEAGEVVSTRGVEAVEARS